MMTADEGGKMSRGKSFDMNKHQGEVREVKKGIEEKKQESVNLEKKKEELTNVMTEIMGANLDEKVVNTVHELINKALESNREEADKASTEMNEGISKLENIKQETEESKMDAQKQKTSIDQKQRVLEKIGAGGLLDGAGKEIDANIQELSDLNNDVTMVMEEAMKIASKLSGL